MTKLADKDQKTWAPLQAEGGCHVMTPPREDAQDHDIFILLTCALYVVVNFRKDRGKVLRRTSWKTLHYVDLMQKLKRSKKSTDEPLRKRMQRLHYLMMICKLVQMKTWRCRHKEMCIRTSYKNVKIPSPILKHVMFLMREVLVKITLSSLYGNMQHLLMINIMTCHIISRGYSDVKGMLN